jgi:hypothetical protein
MAPALEVDRSNLVEAYREAWKVDPPAQIMEALGQ